MKRLPLKNTVPVRLRGHHLLCVFGFRGLGYDAAFIAGMAEVIRRLRQPDARVLIVAGVDDICAGCPHTAHPCAFPGAPRDQAVLAALGLTAGEQHQAETLFPAIAAQMTPARLAALCAGCAWASLGVCVEGMQSGRLAAGWREDSAAAEFAVQYESHHERGAGHGH